MDNLVIFQQLLILFGLMSLGFYAQKRGWMTDPVSRSVSAMVVNIFNPMIMLSGAVSRSEDATGAMVLENLILCCIYFAAATLLSYPLLRLIRVPREKRGLYANLLIFANFGFMGIPVVTGLYGSAYVIFVSFYMLFMNTMFYTYGVTIMTGGFSLKKVLNAGTFSCLASMAVFALGLRLPGWAASLLSYGGNTCIPLSMMVIGANLAKSDFKAMLKNPLYHRFLALKMLALPILMVLAVRRLPFDPSLLGIYMVMVSMPSASVPALFAEEQCGEALGLEASQVNMLTTVSCLLTVPIVALFL